MSTGGRFAEQAMSTGVRTDNRLARLALAALTALTIATVETSSSTPQPTQLCAARLGLYCAAQQGNGDACGTCAGMHQHELQTGGCTHGDIMQWCSAQSVSFVGGLCQCSDVDHAGIADGCVPLGLHTPPKIKGNPQVIVQIAESDAGVFDPMEPGRIDWNATTVLVRHCC